MHNVDKNGRDYKNFVAIIAHSYCLMAKYAV